MELRKTVQRIKSFFARGPLIFIGKKQAPEKSDFALSHMKLLKKAIESGRSEGEMAGLKKALVYHVAARMRDKREVVDEKTLQELRKQIGKEIARMRKNLKKRKKPKKPK